MTYQMFLPLLSYPDPVSKPALLRAFDMAATIGGDLTALIHEVDIPHMQHALAEALINLSEMVAAAEARSHTTAGALAEDVRNLGERFRLPVRIERARTRPEFAADHITVAARCHDLTLLVPDALSDDQMAMAEAVVFGSGGPAILFPSSDVAVHLETVAVGWDGSRAAARALRDAMPMLERAKHVVLLTVEDDKPIDPKSVAGVRSLLAHHGVEAKHLAAQRSSLSIGEALQARALDEDAGLLVMGAYGHSRVREFILGGATHTVIGSRRLPVLMSH